MNQFITNQDKKFTFVTNKNAPRYRIIEIDLNDYAEDKWVTIIPVSC